MIDMHAMGKRAKAAAYPLSQAPTAQKNDALHCIADALDQHADAILTANRIDLDAARADGLSSALIDRLDLQTRLSAVAADVRRVAALPDPVGDVFDERTLDNGLRVYRRRVPLGVVGVIYESRPNVTVDCAALTLKSGCAAILRGGKETVNSNRALVGTLRDAITAVGLPADAVQAIDSPDRAYVEQMLKLHESIDIIIPRGGASLHRYCRENSTIPVITGGIGICHLFVDESADVEQALSIIHNAKTSRPSVCNALDTILVSQTIAADFLPRVVEHLGVSGVTFRAEPGAWAIVGGDARVSPAGQDDFDTEWMSLVLGLKVVDGLEPALEHIRARGDHSDGILSRDAASIERFLNAIDSAAVFVNASTRFNDGGALGLGAEIAVSTQKLHVRGPMALEGLTSYKWVVVGDGHTR